MADDRTNLPARPDRDEIQKRTDGTQKAMQVRDPITGFFHRLGSKIATRSLEAHTEETKAFTGNVDAQSDAVRSIMNLRDTVDDYRARDELADVHYENARERQLDKIEHEKRERELARERHKQATIEAKRDTFNSKQGLENQKRLQKRNFRIWEKRTEAQELDAHVEAERVRSEFTGEDKLAAKANSRDSIRTKAEEALIAALADGNDAEAERWQRVLDALESE